MAHRRFSPYTPIVLLLVLGLTPVSRAQNKRKTQRVLIETAKPYNRVTDAIRARGGSVTWEYKYVDGIAAVIPEDAIDDIRTIAGSSSIDKDLDIPRPALVG